MNESEQLFNELGYVSVPCSNGKRYEHASGATVTIRKDGVDITSVHGNIVDLIHAVELAERETCE